LLGVISAGTAIGGLLLILGGKALVLRIFLSPPEAEVPALLLAGLKETGGLLLVMSLLVFFALRDPARNVAIIDALIFGLCLASVTPLFSFYTLGLERFFPAYLIWVRALVRLAFAGLLYYLRPHEFSGAQG
jgi:hypothetical protein